MLGILLLGSVSKSVFINYILMITLRGTGHVFLPSVTAGKKIFFENLFVTIQKYLKHCKVIRFS